MVRGLCHQDKVGLGFQKCPWAFPYSQNLPLQVFLLALASHFPELCPHIYHVRLFIPGDWPTQCLTTYTLTWIFGVLHPLLAPDSEPRYHIFSCLCTHSNLWSSTGHFSPKGKNALFCSKANTEGLF